MVNDGFLNKWMMVNLMVNWTSEAAPGIGIDIHLCSLIQTNYQTNFCYRTRLYTALYFLAERSNNVPRRSYFGTLKETMLTWGKQKSSHSRFFQV